MAQNGEEAIEDISATLNSTSERAIIYGSKRRRGSYDLWLKTEKRPVRRSFLCARTRGEGMFTPSEAERNFADKKRAVWKLHSNVSKIPLPYQMVGGTRLELMTSAV